MFRHFFLTFRRFPLSTILNTIGLSIAFAAFIVLMMQVHYEYTFGTDDPNTARIYRVESFMEDAAWGNGIDKKIMNHLWQNEPMVEGIAAFEAPNGGLYITTKKEEKANREVKYALLGNDISKVFQFEMVQGKIEDLNQPENVIIPLSLSKELFGNDVAVGQPLYGEIKNRSHRATMPFDKTICGVYLDFPKNSFFENVIYFTPYEGVGEFQSDQLSTSYNQNFILVAPNADTAMILTNFRKTFDEKGVYDSSSQIRLTMAKDVYFSTDRDEFDLLPKGSKSTTNLLLSISILIILIAVINFINFSTALVPKRIAEYNMMLISGCSIARIRAMILFEALCIAFCSYLLSLFLITILNNTSLLTLLKTTSTTITGNLTLVLVCAILSLVVGLLAGVYPAYYSTRFKPSIILKGSFGLSSKGKWLRNSLIGLQYVISIALIVSSLLITMQNHYLRSTPVGFEKDHVIQFRMGISDNDLTTHKTFREKLLQNSNILGVTFSRGEIGAYSNSSMKIQTTYGAQMEINTLAVEPSFLETMRIKIVEGRDFREDDMVEGQKWWDVINGNQNRPAKIIISQKTAQLGGFKVDSLLDKRWEVVGICNNLHYTSLRDQVGLFGFVVSPNNYYCYVKMSAENRKQTIGSIAQQFDELNTSQLFNPQYLDERLAAQYKKEQNLSLLITIFSMLAVIIALVGVFGLVVFETGYRRKEIGIRRINGASVASILLMFNRKFTWLIMICFVIAAPIAWYGVSEWLKGFAYRTQLYWWIFALSLLIVFTITILTVTIQSWRAATENPVKSLKTE